MSDQMLDREGICDLLSGAVEGQSCYGKEWAIVPGIKEKEDIT